LGIFKSISRRYSVFLITAISGIFLFALLGSRGLMQVYHLKLERDRIQRSNAQLIEENKKLAEQIERLRNNREEVEKIAREELKLVRKGEIVYQFER